MDLYFLKFDGMRGESSSVRHLGEIELKGFTWGDAHKAATAGVGAGKASIDDLVLFKKPDRTSTEFRLASTDGRHFREARLTVEKLSASGGLLRTISINMRSILVNSFRFSPDAPPSPSAIEEIGLKFMEMEIRET
jgi:type VI secretion system secreted protein Hcp